MKLTIDIVPLPQSRPRFNSRTRTAYEKADIKSYKRKIGYEAKKVIKHPFEKGIALKLDVIFYMKIPKTLSNVKKHRFKLESDSWLVSKKPDLDNLLKAVLDALNGIAYPDDNQVSEISMKKVYSFKPRIEIEIKECKHD